MCNKQNCGEPDNRKPWCGSCGGHIQEATSSLHQARVHPKPPPVDPTLR